MNSSRCLFTKTILSLAALLFIGGCNSTETAVVTTEYDGFKVEYDKDKRVINFIHTSDENVTIIYKKEGDTGRYTTIDGKTILVLMSAPEHELKFTPSVVAFSRNSDGDALFTLPAL